MRCASPARTRVLFFSHSLRTEGKTKQKNPWLHILVQIRGLFIPNITFPVHENITLKYSVSHYSNVFSLSMGKRKRKKKPNPSIHCRLIPFLEYISHFHSTSKQLESSLGWKTRTLSIIEGEHLHLVRYRCIFATASLEGYPCLQNNWYWTVNDEILQHHSLISQIAENAQSHFRCLIQS